MEKKNSAIQSMKNKQSMGSGSYGSYPGNVQIRKAKSLRGKLIKGASDTTNVAGPSKRTPIPTKISNKPPTPIPTKIGNAKRKYL